MKASRNHWVSIKRILISPLFRRWGLFVLFALPYILYIFFVVQSDQGPIDYETFMRIGRQLTSGGDIYTENSYYPLPYVILFSFFYQLPRSISMILWLLIPVVAALFVSKFNPWILLFSPVASHFFGGQTSIFGMLGLWGYQQSKYPENFMGGVWLAIMTMKPQLAIFPLIWAGVHWIKFLITNKKIPIQIFSFMGTFVFMQIPGFLILPNWPQLWLASPRPLSERALAGLIPRLLLYEIEPENWQFWLALMVLSILLFLLVWKINEKSLSFELFMITSFIVNPLIHDYDLLQFVPLLKNKKILIATIAASLPGWITIFFFYDVDEAWFVFTFIAPVALWAYLKKCKKENVSNLNKHIKLVGK